jgi:hypothetical protein
MVGCLGLLAAADAQTPSSSSAGAAFDGTYEFVSSTKLTEMYTTLIANGPMSGPDTGATHHREGSAAVFHFFHPCGVRRNGWVSGRVGDAISLAGWRPASRKNAKRQDRRRRDGTRTPDRDEL